MARAAHEQALAKKTWFITLTYAPRHRESILIRATREGSEQSTGRRLVSAAGSYVSDYFKALRKRGHEFRYLCIPELHRDGFPHWHGLVHSKSGELTWSDLTLAWSCGFSVVKLVRDANALRYVTKYLCKEKLGRVRASLNYGASGLEAERPDATPSNGTAGPERGGEKGLGKEEKEKNGISCQI